MKEELKKLLEEELVKKIELIENFYNILTTEEVALTEEQIKRINSNVSDLIDYKINQMSESSKEVLKNTRQEIEQVKSSYEALKTLSYDFTQNKLKTEDLKKSIDSILKSVDSNELLKKIELVRRLQSFDVNNMNKVYESSHSDLQKAFSKNVKSSLLLGVSFFVFIGTFFYTTNVLKDVKVFKEEINKKQEIVNNLDEIIIKLNKEKTNLKDELRVTYLPFMETNCLYRSDLKNDILKLIDKGYKVQQTQDKKLYLYNEENEKLIGYCK